MDRLTFFTATKAPASARPTNATTAASTSEPTPRTADPAETSAAPTTVFKDNVSLHHQINALLAKPLSKNGKPVQELYSNPGILSPMPTIRVLPLSSQQNLETHIGECELQLPLKF